MSDLRLYNDSKIVKVITAEAMGESIDSAVRADVNEAIQSLLAELSPHNKYLIGQLVGFSVTEMNKKQENLYQMIGDFKRIQENDKAVFNITLPGIKAFIQAKGATTAVSKVAQKRVSLDTIAVSTRPRLNIVEMRSGQTNMAELVRQASSEMTLVKNAYIYKVLLDAATSWTEPFYGSGSGIVKDTLNPMLQHWMRYGGATILGDIALITKLADETGFTASSTVKQFADQYIIEQNRNGFIGTYYGSNVVQMVNPYGADGLTTILDKDKLFILPQGVSTDMRPLKVVEEGDMIVQDHTDIDDLTMEMRMDQHFGAGVVYGVTPYLSIYEDTSM